MESATSKENRMQEVKIWLQKMLILAWLHVAVSRTIQSKFRSNIEEVDEVLKADLAYSPDHSKFTCAGVECPHSAFGVPDPPNCVRIEDPGNCCGKLICGEFPQSI